MGARPEILLAVDLGGTKVRAALATPAAEVLSERLEATAHGPAEAYLAQLVGLRAELCATAGIAPGDVLRAGVGVPAALDPAMGRLASTQNVPGLAGQVIGPQLERVLGLPVRVENDANLAALGEGWRGAAVGVADFVVIAVGTGIGAGVVVDGRLVHGAHGWAGELAYLPLGADPFDPVVRLHGAFEAAAAGPALGARIGGPVVRLEDVVARAAGGDRAALALIEDEARLLALGVAAVAAVVDPALVVLSGGVGAVEGLLEPVRRWVAELLQHAPEVRRGALGDRAALVGAIALAARSS